MSPLQLVCVWYVFIGLVVGYLVAHEYVTNGSFKKAWGANLAGGVFRVAMMGAVNVVVWPRTLWVHVRAGTITDLFK